MKEELESTGFPMSMVERKTRYMGKSMGGEGDSSAVQIFSLHSFDIAWRLGLQCIFGDGNLVCIYMGLERGLEGLLAYVRYL